LGSTRAAPCRRGLWRRAHSWLRILAQPPQPWAGAPRSGGRGETERLGAISGAVAGLVAITPAAGFVSPMSAIAIGLAAGVFCFLMVTKVKSMFRYDDSLDAFGVHGAAEPWSSADGRLRSSAVNPIFKNARGRTLASGLIEGNPRQLLNQLAGIAIAWALAIVGTVVLLKLVDITIGLRVSEDHEMQGLDLSPARRRGIFLGFARITRNRNGSNRFNRTENHDKARSDYSSFQAGSRERRLARGWRRGHDRF